MWLRKTATSGRVLVPETDKMSQNERFPPTRSVLLGCAAFLLVALAAGPARADDTINRPGNHPAYDFEAEPHLLLSDGGPWGYYGGLGLGVRFGIPIVSNGFVSTINNSVAISFGVDWAHSDWWCGNNQFNCASDSFVIPVTLQWNFYVAQRWSVFGEPGLAFYHAFCDGPGGACGGFLSPALYIGARYYFTDAVALNMRLGFPSGLSIGLSFFP